MTSHLTPRHPARSPRAVGRRIVVLLAAAAVASSTVAACSGSPSSSGKAGDTLRIAISAAPPTLDPAKADVSAGYPDNLAYEPLIVQASDGTLKPGLATSWSFTDDRNTALRLQLRPGVKFSDGSALTAQTVVDFFTYFTKAAGPNSALLTGAKFAATGPLAVTITLPTPNPDFVTQLTQHSMLSQVISSSGLRDPVKLGTQTFGAGPYRLDTAQTVTGDHYTYVPNPNFYDQARVYWKRVVIRVITNPQTILNALKTGEIDFAQADDPSTIPAAQQAGLTVTSTPVLWNGINLLDRKGMVSKPLADVRVRQALNYATDRAAISKAIFPGTSAPISQISVPDGWGYDPALEKFYPYDVAKAKQLLAAAGYPNGFSLKLVSGDVASMNLVAQAVREQWRQVGVNVQVTDYPNNDQYASNAFGGKFPATTTVWGVLPLGMQGPLLFLPSAHANPFHVSDPQLQSLYDADMKATGDAKQRQDRAVVGYLTQQAWFVPIFSTGLAYYARKTITGTSVSPQAPNASLYEIRPAT